MFDIVVNMMKDFATLIPGILAIYIVLDLCGSLLFGGNN